MIKSWKHKGLERFFNHNDKSGIQPAHAARLRMILQMLDVAEEPQQLNVPGFFFHALKGKEQGYYSLRVNGNWRVIFKFEGKHAVLANYLDYH